MSAPASYDLNAVADALAAVFNNLDTGLELDGQDMKLTAHADVPSNVEVPALILELNEIDWDQTMGGGEDEVGFIATILVEFQDSVTAQRSLRSFLSRDGAVGRLKAALLANQSLGGLVSYAHMTNIRRLGTIEFGGAQYLGVEIPIEIVS